MKKTATVVFLSMLICISILSACNKTRLNPSDDNGQPEPNDVESSVGVSSQIKYMSFEETLSAATDIMVATYTGKTERRGMYYDLEFAPIKQIKGTQKGENIYVSLCTQSVGVAGTGIEYVESPSGYVVGAEYVLVLEKHISVYTPYDVYLPLNNILIKSGETPTMYNGSFVGNFSTASMEEKSSDEILEYIEKFQLTGTDVSRVVGHDFIKSTDLTKIVTLSSIVAEVVPIELIGASENNNTERFLCTVTDVLKGNVPDEKIKIIFVADTVKIGSKYTVMLEHYGTSIYHILSSKNSVYATNEAFSNSVKAILQHSSEGQAIF